MPEIPRLKDEINMLRLHKSSLGYSNVQLAAKMAFFGWDGAFNAASLAALFAGRTKLDTLEKREFVRAFLLEYYISTL